MVFGSRTTLVLVYTLYLCLFFVRSTTTLKQPRYENRIANYYHRSVDFVQCVHQRSHWPVTTLTYSNEYEGCKLGTKHRSRKSSSSYYPQHECPIHLFTSNFFFHLFRSTRNSLQQQTIRSKVEVAAEAATRAFSFQILIITCFYSQWRSRRIHFISHANAHRRSDYSKANVFKNSNAGQHTFTIANGDIVLIVQWLNASTN